MIVETKFEIGDEAWYLSNSNTFTSSITHGKIESIEICIKESTVIKYSINKKTVYESQAFASLEELKNNLEEFVKIYRDELFKEVREYEMVQNG